MWYVDTSGNSSLPRFGVSSDLLSALIGASRSEQFQALRTVHLSPWKRLEISSYILRSNLFFFFPSNVFECTQCGLLLLLSVCLTAFQVCKETRSAAAVVTYCPQQPSPLKDSTTAVQGQVYLQIVDGSRLLANQLLRPRWHLLIHSHAPLRTNI